MPKEHKRGHQTHHCELGSLPKASDFQFNTRGLAETSQTKGWDQKDHAEGKACADIGRRARARA